MPTDDQVKDIDEKHEATQEAAAEEDTAVKDASNS
jgi:hypothetical protein